MVDPPPAPALAGQRPAPEAGATVRRWLSAPALTAAGLVALAALALYVALAAGVRGVAAVPDLARGAGAAIVLFAVAGEAVTRRLLPPAMAPLRALFVLPIGAAVSGLALTALGFARLPLAASIAVVLAGGLIASLAVRRRGPPAPRADPAALAFAAVASLVVAVALIPSFRGGFATVPGENPDAHLVTGVAVLLQEDHPTATRIDLPVDRMPAVWRSKYPIFYSLAAVSTLSGLDPIAAFPAVDALLTGFVAVGFGLLAVYVLGLSPLGGAFVAAVTGWSAMTLYVALLPYWNHLWGLAMLPFSLIFAWQAVAARDRGAAGLLAVTVLLAAFAYPLMLPYPLVALAGFAVALRRRPPLPRWSRGRWLGVVVLLGALLAVPLVGVVEKSSEAARSLLDPTDDLASWSGALGSDFLPLGAFVSAGEALPVAAVVVALAILALVRFVPRAAAVGFGVLLALSALADVRLRLAEFGAYFDFKHLSFVGPIVLALAATAVAALVARRGRAGVALGIAAVIGWAAVATVEVRDEVKRRFDLVTRDMLELRQWSRELPREASIRIDFPPSGYQLWAGYLVAEHPVTALYPVTGTTYPHPPRGSRADYSLAPARLLSDDPSLQRRAFPRPPGAIDPPVRRNGQFVLRRLARLPGPETASRRMVEGVPGPPAPPG